MSTECSDLGEEFWLPEEFLDDDFFSEEEKAAVAARSESDEEDILAGLSRRLAGLLGDDAERKAPAKVGFRGCMLHGAGWNLAPSFSLRPTPSRLFLGARRGFPDCEILGCRRR